MSLAKIILSNISQCFFLSLTKISSYMICTMYLSQSERFSAFYFHCGPLILCSTPQCWVRSLCFNPVLTPFCVLLSVMDPFSVLYPSADPVLCVFTPVLGLFLRFYPLCWFHSLCFTPVLIPLSQFHSSSCYVCTPWFKFSMWCWYSCSVCSSFIY